MLVLLPPSETKLDGGDGPPLRLSALAHPELTPLRAELVDDLVKLSADVAAARAALGLSAHQDAEVERNARLWSAPTAPALHRYTGVLYDALDVRSLRGAAAVRARARLAVGSALFGLLRAEDPVPAYRLSAGSALPGRGTLGATARLLAASRAEPTDAAGVAGIARRACMRVERRGNALEVILPAA